MKTNPDVDAAATVIGYFCIEAIKWVGIGLAIEVFWWYVLPYIVGYVL